MGLCQFVLNAARSMYGYQFKKKNKSMHLMIDKKNPQGLLIKFLWNAPPTFKQL